MDAQYRTKLRNLHEVLTNKWPTANWDLGDLKNRLKQAGSSQNSGTVHQVRGLVIEADGPNLAIGDTCRIETRGGRASVFAEVVGFRDHRCC